MRASLSKKNVTLRSVTAYAKKRIKIHLSCINIHEAIVKVGYCCFCCAAVAREKQIPCGNDRKKSKGKCKRRFPAGMTNRSYGMTRLALLQMQTNGSILNYGSEIC
jgi:hypothetical protein